MLSTMCVALLCNLGQSVPQPGSPAAQAPATDQPAALAGPALPERVQRVTLVERDFNNRLRRPQTSPSEAALGLLSLDASVKARVDAIIGARAAAMDRFVSGNLLLLGQLDSAGKAGDKVDQLVTIVELVDRLRPVLDDGALDAQIAAALPPEPAARFHRLVAEYWRAVIAEGVAESRRIGKNDPRWAVYLGERIKHLGEEIGRSYQRQVSAGTLILDYLLSDLGLSDSQRATMLRLKVDFLQRTNFRPTEKQQQLFVAGAIGYLNESQRATVLKRIANNK